MFVRSSKQNLITTELIAGIGRKAEKSPATSWVEVKRVKERKQDQNLTIFGVAK